MNLENIRIFREMFGVSQEYVAAKIERGETKITWLLLTEIAMVLNIEVKKNN